MEYKVIHMIEAAGWIEEREYSRLVEQCGQIYRFLSDNEACREQYCMTFADTVKKIQMKNGHWPGDATFRRQRRRKKYDINEKTVCFEEALNTAAACMTDGGAWIIILYTAGAVKRSKRTMLNKWKKTLAVVPILLAVKTDLADRNFLESYTEVERVFSAGALEKVVQWLGEYENGEQDRSLNRQERNAASRETEELWKIIRDCFL